MNIYFVKHKHIFEIYEKKLYAQVSQKNSCIRGKKKERISKNERNANK